MEAYTRATRCTLAGGSPGRLLLRNPGTVVAPGGRVWSNPGLRSPPDAASRRLNSPIVPRKTGRVRHVGDRIGGSDAIQDAT